jgi:uroporphyrin-III C-methyltransferase / precorrin-2 dehydrogenase / sirohydrochlorin ferrochelatase
LAVGIERGGLKRAMSPRLKFLPVSYAVEGRVVRIVGEGERAIQKLRLLLRSGAAIVLHAPCADESLRAFAVEHAVMLLGRLPVQDELADTALLFVATDDSALEAEMAGRARRARVPVNVVDRLDLSDFAIPAIVDRAPIAVAISTDGTAPVLAQRLRETIEQLLPPTLGALGELAAALRATVRKRLAGADARRRFWRTVFDGPIADAALAGDVAGARRRAIRALDQADAPAEGRVFLVGAGPGASDLLTLRAQRLLQETDVIVHDALVPQAVIDMGRRDARRIPVGKRKGSHSATQAEINALLVTLAGAGHRVVRLKAGDPLVFGRAGEEIAALRAAGIAHEIVPGITAALAAAADARASLTLRGSASQLVFVTGHGAGGSDARGWEKLAATGATVALYMGSTVAHAIRERLRDAGMDPATPVVAVEACGTRGSPGFRRNARRPARAPRVRRERRPRPRPARPGDGRGGHRPSRNPRDAGASRRLTGSSMAKKPDPFAPVVATANALRSGAVVFRTPAGAWTADIAAAEIAADPAAAEAAARRRAARSRRVPRRRAGPHRSSARRGVRPSGGATRAHPCDRADDRTAVLHRPREDLNRSNICHVSLRRIRRRLRQGARGQFRDQVERRLPAS